MVFVLTTPLGSGHIQGFIQRFSRDYGRRLVEMTYADLARRGRAVSGAYIFTDFIRMSPWFKSIAIDLWDQLAAGGDAVRLYNNPARQLGRYELLRSLHDKGLNEFNVYKIDELGSATLQFPVFLRLENDHTGPKSELITSVDRLWSEVARLILAGLSPGDLLVTEYVETRDAEGVFRKYGAWRFGDRIVGQHCLLSKNWNVKAEGRIRTEKALAETDDYFEANPHKDRLMTYFEIANIEYGRLDYSLLGDKIQVWEINDNPQYFGRKPMMRNLYGKGEAFMNAYEQLDRGVVEGRTLELEPSRILRMAPAPAQ
jgi:hypothetical protein